MSLLCRFAVIATTEKALMASVCEEFVYLLISFGFFVFFRLFSKERLNQIIFSCVQQTKVAQYCYFNQKTHQALYFRTQTFSLETNQSTICLDLFVYMRKINKITQIEKENKTKQESRSGCFLQGVL